tara:strand:+ start:103 stop:585 length:483 start_codon:yes stop_codon:yes gene_type:complete
MALTKKAADRKYDELKEKLKAGDITKERFKQAANRIHKMYHSDANKATRNAKPAAPKPRQTTRKEAEARFYSSSSQGAIAQNQEKAKSNFFRSSSGTRGQNMPSQPKLKSKPKRSDYPAGRAGQSRYAEALRRYNKPATRRTRRAIRNFTDRRRARRSSR